MSVGFAGATAVNEVVEAIGDAGENIGSLAVFNQFGQFRQSLLLFLQFLLRQLCLLLRIFNFLLDLKLHLINAHVSVKTVQQAMPELRLFVPVEYYFGTLFVRKNRAGRNQIFCSLDPKYLSFLLVPDENLRVLYSLVSLSKIVLKMSFPLALHKVTFPLLLFDLGHIHPPVLIRAEPRDSKDIILEDLVMLTLNTDRVEPCTLLNPAFFIVLELFRDRLQLVSGINLIDRQKYLFLIFRIGIRGTKSVTKLEKRVGDHFDSGRGWKTTQVSFDYREYRFH